MDGAVTTPERPIRDIPLEQALSERYLAYALSTITSRSLPDVRDGLKPVHRRLLYAMRQLGLDPASGFKKCARVVGDVIGKYHPHGDVAVYDALVRLAQEFAVRYPLIEGQGNFGNVDGDNAAAMRYTEARLTEYAQALLGGIDEDAVDFRANYDGSEREPIVLPATVPNLLANGASGIAVGMATNIPPHNIDEICTALLHLLKTPDARIKTLVDLMPGPDFPTGGVLMESRAAVLESYATGRGSFRLRAKWHKEELKHGQYQVVVTEVPYQVQKARLVEKIAELFGEKKLPLLGDVRDESAADIRLVLEPKSRTVTPEALMESLFRATELETRFGLNLNVLEAGRTPKVMSVKDVLRSFLEHRMEVLVRRSKYRVSEIERRLEVLGGYLIVYLHLDTVIKIIRNEDEPKPALMKRFKLTDPQAEAILNMRLRALRRLEEKAIKAEFDELTKEKTELAKLLKDKARREKRIGEEIEDVRKRFGKKTALGKRRTEIGDAPAEIDIPVETMVEREPITVICSDKGWIRVAKGHLTPDAAAELKYKEGDQARFVVHGETTDKILVFGTNGRFYTLSPDKLPSARGHGEPIRLMVDLGNEEDIVALKVQKPGAKLVVASSLGYGFVVAENDVVAQTRGGKQVLNLPEGEGAVARAAAPVAGDHIAVVGDNRKLIAFPVAELPEMGRGRGVRLQKYKDGGLSDVTTFTKTEGLTFRAGDKTRTETDLAGWIGKRGQAGRIAPKGFSKTNKFQG